MRLDLKTENLEAKAGSIVAISAGHPHDSPVEKVFEPSVSQSVHHLFFTRSKVFVVVLDQAVSKVLSLTLLKKSWEATVLPFSENGSIENVSSSPYESQFIASFTSFLSPPSYFLFHEEVAQDQCPMPLKRATQRFDASQLEVHQEKAKSQDGTEIPYFLVHKKGILHDGSHPTLLYGYGGFEVSESPYYLGLHGKLWLEKGGVYAVANIRGGGEFGPKWHQAVLKEKRQNAFDDFRAVAQDLVARNLTSSRHLEIVGGSNGGILGRCIICT